ncbi:patatin-like phospholipase family protein [Croceivirga thetidis]|uniref:Patatin-like phospholipase family protein n=1 Tax=Croceivirga thetidis TaxID=2721623 RepID=A0ABX1GMS8_9FLAO|nr:patatin-like phospholipase family protein [Croceivirga thetidis]NKI31179.1 patatin-like phospholipase family protein [Croceivirga thetidis]
MNSIGLVLSGGGVRGMAHIGLIKAMQEHGLEAKVVSGSSIGALVGAFYANDTPVETMLQFFKETPLFQYSFFAFGKPGFINTDRYAPILKKHFENDSFATLKKPLYVVATDMQNGLEKVFSEGQLIKPLLASAALSPVFSPVLIDDILYADGGIMNNFPKEYVDAESDFVIGSNVSIAGKLEQKDLSNSIQLATRITGLMVYASSHDKLQQCDLQIEPTELENIGVLDKKGIEKAYTIGYDYSMKVLDEKIAQG